MFFCVHPIFFNLLKILPLHLQWLPKCLKQQLLSIQTIHHSLTKIRLLSIVSSANFSRYFSGTDICRRDPESCFLLSQVAKHVFSRRKFFLSAGQLTAILIVNGQYLPTEIHFSPIHLHITVILDAVEMASSTGVTCRKQGESSFADVSGKHQLR